MNEPFQEIKPKRLRGRAIKKRKTVQLHVPEGQQVSETSGSHKRRKVTGSSSGTSEGLHSDSPCERSAKLEDSCESAFRSNNTGELGVVGQNEGQTGSSDILAEQVHTEPNANAGEHPEQQPSDNQSGGAGSGGSVDAKTIESLRDPAIYCGTFCHDPEERFVYAPKQVEFLRACQVIDNQGRLNLDDYPKNIALAAVNEFGKTLLIADLIRYFLDWVPGCVVGFTSHVSRQCEMLESYLKKQQALPRYKDSWKCAGDKLEAPNGNWARWFTAKDEGAVESLHAPRFMVRILDEVKSMDDGIVDATARWKPKLTIFISSKGLMRGRFYEAFTANRHLFTHVEATAYDCPWMSQKSIEHDIELNGGRNSAIVRSMIFNEWSDVSVKSLISLDLVEKAINHPPPWKHNGIVVAGLDVSAAKKGGDECVLAWRKGNKVDLWVVPYSESEMEVIGRVIHKLREIKASCVFVDAGGAGGFAAGRLEEVLAGDSSIQVYRENFGGSCISPSSIAWRRGTELWCNGLDKLERRDLILPNDPKLLSQITSREYIPRSDGKITLIDKQAMRKKGIKSPDRADAVFLCLTEPYSKRLMKTIDTEYEIGLQANGDRWTSYNGGHDLGQM